MVGCFGYQVDRNLRGTVWDFGALTKVRWWRKIGDPTCNPMPWQFCVLVTFLGWWSWWPPTYRGSLKVTAAESPGGCFFSPKIPHDFLRTKKKPYSTGSMGSRVFTDPWILVDFHGINLGKYTSPMDGIWVTWQNTGEGEKGSISITPFSPHPHPT